jgi:hypothetical protein
MAVLIDDFIKLRSNIISKLNRFKKTQNFRKIS